MKILQAPPMASNARHNCPVDAMLDVIGGKWKMPILWTLSQKTHRFGELRRAIPDVTEKVLAQQLRQLEADGLVWREEFPEVPPRMEYSLTERGRTLIPVLNRVADWGAQHLSDRVADATPAA